MTNIVETLTDPGPRVRSPDPHRAEAVRELLVDVVRLTSPGRSVVASDDGLAIDFEASACDAADLHRRITAHAEVVTAALLHSDTIRRASPADDAQRAHRTAVLIEAFAEWPLEWVVAWGRVADAIEAAGDPRLDAELRAVHVLDPARCPWWKPPKLLLALRARTLDRAGATVVDLTKHRGRKRRKGRRR